MLSNFDDRSVNRIRCVLGLVAFSKRPVGRLELLSAVTFSSGNPVDGQLAPQYLLETCGPLVVERHDNSHVFIHLSVKESVHVSNWAIGSTPP